MAKAVASLAEVRGWFKDASLEDMGRKYWKKRSYVFPRVCKDNPLTDDKHRRIQSDALLLAHRSSRSLRQH